MITRSNIRFLAVGLALGFLLAIFIFVPAKEDLSSQNGPQMSIVMNLENVSPLPANQIIIPAATTRELFPFRVQFPVSNQETEIERAIRRAAQQKYHLIYRETPPIN